MIYGIIGLLACGVIIGWLPVFIYYKGIKDGQERLRQFFEKRVNDD